MAARRKDGRRRTDADTEATTLVADGTRQADEQVEEAASAFAVRKVLKEMKGVRDRDVLFRFYLNDEDKESICRDLQLTELLFNQVLFRARNRFRELLTLKGHAKRDLLSVVL